jgi:hypothetical protein
MSKLTSLAVGLLSALAIVPASSAMAATSNPTHNLTPAGDLHAQVIFKIGPQYRERGYDRGYSRWEIERQRRLEWEREREARARWRSGYYDRGRYDRGYRRDYDRDYRYYR